MENLISRALAIYLTGGDRAWPTRDEGALVQTLGDETAAELMPALDTLVTEMLAIPVDWENHTLWSGTAQAQAEMHRRHPDLTDEALAALGSYFSYQWK